jgi:hypothetical protein
MTASTVEFDLPAIDQNYKQHERINWLDWAGRTHTRERLLVEILDTSSIVVFQLDRLLRGVCGVSTDR